MKINLFADYETLCRHTADLVINYLHKKPDALVCLASGHTPLGVFKLLVADAAAGRVDLSRCTFVGLDEWAGMGPHHDGSCRQMMDDYFFKPASIADTHIEFFDALAADLPAEAARIDRVIAQRGGLDIMLVGVGTNGHIAMNEPGTSFDVTSHVSELAEETRTVGQKYFKSETPLSHGITLGLGHFRQSKLPILMASGPSKADVMRRALTGPVTTDVPASIVQTIPHSYVMLDQEAGRHVAAS